MCGKDLRLFTWKARIGLGEQFASFAQQHSASDGSRTSERGFENPNVSFSTLISRDTRHDAAPGRVEGRLARGPALLDLIITTDAATRELYSAFLVDEEGTLSSFRGLGRGDRAAWPVHGALHRSR
jgi:hypothetical protein